MATVTRLLYRHPLSLRLMHWINVLSLTILLGSGLQIFNAHPSLSWGQANTPGRTWLSLDAPAGPDGMPRGTTTIAGHTFHTDGVLGASTVDGEHVARGFPAWVTVPGPGWLAMGRRWHFFFAWVFVLNGATYLAWSVWTRHLQRDLVPTGADLRAIGPTVLHHLRPDPDAVTKRYNVLQRLAYLSVLIACVGIACMGLAMSPRLDAAVPWLVDAVGGRQSARSIHFLLAGFLVAFVAVHLFEVLFNGVLNQLRSIVTGHVRVKETIDD